MKRILALLLAATMLLGMAACKSPEAETLPAAPAASDGTAGTAGAPTSGTTGTAPEVKTEPKYKSEVVFAPSLDFMTYEVQDTTSAVTKGCINLLYDTLITQDTVTHELVPMLATSWKQVNDKCFEFKLRDDVYFHNGDHFTAADVKFTYEKGTNSKASKSRLGSIESCTVVDDYTVQVNLKNPDLDLLYKICDETTSILSKKAYDTMAPEEAVKIGTGPMMHDEWQQGEFIRFVRYDQYWGTPVNYESFKLVSIPEASARLIALQTGEVDIIQSPASTDIHYIAEDKNLNLLQFPSTNVIYIGINTKKAPFDNLKLRQAIAYGMNRDDYVIGVYDGNATTTNNVMHPSNAFYAEVDGYEYNPEKAKQLLAEAGYANGLTVEVTTKVGTNNEKAAIVFQAQMAAIDITVKINSLETAAFTAYVAPGSNYDLMVNAWSGYANGPDNAMRQILYTGAANNCFNVSDPKIDELIDTAVSTSDEAKRKALYAELEQYVISDAYFLPFCVEVVTLGTRANVEGYLPPSGIRHRHRGISILEN